MFLQKQRLNKECHRNSYLQSNKLEDILKRISIPEIKSHKKCNPYLNPRDLLINTTQKIFKQNTKLINKQDRRNNSQLTNINHRLLTRNSMGNNSDLSTRESRMIAARRYREKIAKRNDITPYIRAQEQLTLSRRSQVMRFSHNESSDRVQRYRDMLKEFASEGPNDKKELIKNYWLTGGAGKNHSQKNNTSKNPELPITKIEFNDLEDHNSHSRVLINRQRRSSVRRNNYTSYSSHGKRPIRANPNPFQDDNFIEPW